MEFKKLTISDKHLFDKYTTNYINAESSFANIMMWNGSYFNAEYAVCCDTLVMRYSSSAGRQRFSMPYGASGGIIDATHQLCIHCREDNVPLEIIDGNEAFIDTVLSCGRFDIQYSQNRDYQEYVYLSESLANLAGKELHAKKNHVNKFKSLYDYRFVPLDRTYADVCKQKARIWLDGKYNGNADEYAVEFKSLVTALDNFDYFGLFGGAIFVGEELVAFTVGEELTSDTALVHIEKADISYKGAFAAINYEFANYVKDKYKYLNREEDMGIEGLRKAKLSYRPAFLTDKYKCIIKEV